MGLRFRKSVKICKGVRINFNKKSFGLSIGGKGYGYSFNSNGRRTKHFGIPNTGLSYVSSSSPKSNYKNPKPRVVQTTIRMHMNDDGTISYFYPNGTEIKDQSIINKVKRAPEYKSEKARMQMEHDQEMLDRVIKYNKSNNDLININKLCPEEIYMEQYYRDILNTLEVEKYEKKQFDQPAPTVDSIKNELREKANKEIKSVAVWTLNKKRNEYIEKNYNELYNTRYNNWLKQKEEFDSNQEKLEIENNLKFEENYKNQKKYLINILDGDEECICNDIDLWFSDLEMPFDFNIDYEYIKEKQSLFIDLDLPEIEDFPHQKAVQLANGNMKLQNKNQSDIYIDYKNYVFGLVLFISSHIFNISPKINIIIISGYTQRRDKKGEINNDYVCSIKFEREKLKQKDLLAGDSYNICMDFENRCNIGANNLLKSIIPYGKD